MTMKVWIVTETIESVDVWSMTIYGVYDSLEKAKQIVASMPPSYSTEWDYEEYDVQ